MFQNLLKLLVPLSKYNILKIKVIFWYFKRKYVIHQYVYSTFRFVGIKVWNYITDHINTQVSLPKFKKILKTHIQSDSFTLAL